MGGGVGPARRRQTFFEWILEHRPETAAHPGARLVQPICQGDYDGLCGLYCILNAIRLVAAPYRILNHKESQTLFVTGVRFLDTAGILPKAVCWSIEKRRWHRLADVMRREARRSLGLTLHFDNPFANGQGVATAEALEAIERMIGQHKAIMVFVRGAYRHYTVIAGYTPESFKLFDSYGYRWIRKACCTTDPDEKARHQLHIESMIVVSVH